MADGFKGLLDKAGPYLLGAGLAAAGGFNPAVGLLAGPGLAAGRDRRKLENEMTREQIRGLRSQNEGIERVQSVLRTHTVPQPSNLLLDVEGGEPMSLQGIVDPERAQLSESRVPIDTPEGRNDLLSAMMGAAPGGTSQSLLGELLPPSRKPTGFEQDLMRIDFLKKMGLSDEELQKATVRMFTGKPSDDLGLEAIMAQLELQMTMMELNRAQEADEVERLKREQTEKKVEVSTLRSFGELRELSRLNDVLANARYIKPGLVSELMAKGIPVVTAIAQSQGLEGPELDRLEAEWAAYQSFNQLANSIAISRMGADAEEFARSDTRLRAFRDTKPSFNLGAATNGMVISRMFEELLDFSDIMKFSIPEKDAIEAEIARIKNVYSGEFGTGGAPGAYNPRDKTPPPGWVPVPER